MERTINRSSEMRILFTFTFPLDPNAGGIQRVTSVLINEFTRKGITASFLQCDEIYNKFIYNGVEYNDISSIIKDFNVIINQDGYDDTFTKMLIQKKWIGKYIICLHSTPDMFKEYYSFKSMIHGLIHSTWSKNGILFGS